MAYRVTQAGVAVASVDNSSWRVTQAGIAVASVNDSSWRVTQAGVAVAYHESSAPPEPADGSDGLEFSDVAVALESPIVVALSVHIGGGGEATTAQLDPPDGKATGDFTPGRIQDDENPADSVDIGVQDYTELEWVLKATSEAESGEVYEFQIVESDGTELAVYDVTPEVTLSGGLLDSASDGFEFSDDADSEHHQKDEESDKFLFSDVADDRIDAKDDSLDGFEFSDLAEARHQGNFVVHNDEGFEFTDEATAKLGVHRPQGEAKDRLLWSDVASAVKTSQSLAKKVLHYLRMGDR